MRHLRTFALWSAACLALTGTGPAVSPFAGYAYTAAAAGQSGELNGLQYTTENGYGMITGFTDALPAELTIPEKIDGYSVTRIDINAFKNCTVLQSVTLPDSVEELGYACFYGCTNLAEIRFPEHISDFGQYAVTGTKWFADQQAKNPMVIAANVLIDGTGCTGEVTVPDSVGIIGIQAFKNNTKLTGIKLPETLDKIDSWAFEGCTGLKEVSIPASPYFFIEDDGLLDNASSIERGCFRNCTGLESVVFEDGVTKIEDDVFTGCTSLKSISFPQTLTRIGSSFSKCSALKEVTIPASVKIVDPEAFTDCENLETVTVEGYYTCLSDQDWNAVAFSNSGHWADNFTFTGTIRCLNGSLAQEYAEHFNVKSESLGDAPTSGTLFGPITWSLTDDTLTISGNGSLDEFTGLVKVNGQITGSSYQNVPPWFMYRDRIKNVIVGPAVYDIGAALADMTAMESVTIENPNCGIWTGRFTISNGNNEAGKRYYGGVIRGYADSTAQNYAKLYDIPFESLGESPVLIMTTAPAVTWGTAPGTTICGGDCDITTPAAKTTVIQGVTTTAAVQTPDCAEMTGTSAVPAATAKTTTATEAVGTTVIPGVTTTEAAARTTAISGVTTTEATTAVTTGAETSAPDDTFRGKCGESVTWAFNIVMQHLSIEGEGDMTDYDINKQEYSPWYDYAFFEDNFTQRIRTIWIGDGVTSIGAGAFLGCASVESIVVPDNITRIGENAFYLCGGLERLVILNPDCEIADTEWTVSSGIRNNHAFFNGTIVGFKDSTAQKYAKKYGYRFETLETVPESTEPAAGLLVSVKVMPYLKADGYTEAEQAEYQKQADALMKRVRTISATGDFLHPNETDSGTLYTPYRGTETLTADAAEIAALSKYDSKPLSCRIMTFEDRYDTIGSGNVRIDFLNANGEALMSVTVYATAWAKNGENVNYYDKCMAVIDLSKNFAETARERNDAIFVLSSKGAGSEYELADYDCETALGDADGSSDVSVSDAQLTLKAYTEGVAGKDSGLTKAQKMAADINRDGKVSVEDAQLILKYYTENNVAGKNITWKDLLK